MGLLSDPRGEWWRAVTEPAASLLTGAVASPVAGLLGLVTLARQQDAAAAADTVRRVQERLTYQPRTVRGQAGLAGLGAVLEPVNRALEAPGRLSGEHGAPIAGALTTAALATMMPGPKGGRTSLVGPAMQRGSVGPKNGISRASAVP